MASSIHPTMKTKRAAAFSISHCTMISLQEHSPEVFGLKPRPPRTQTLGPEELLSKAAHNLFGLLFGVMGLDLTYLQGPRLEATFQQP